MRRIAVLLSCLTYRHEVESELVDVRAELREAIAIFTLLGDQALCCPLDSANNIKQLRTSMQPEVLFTIFM